MRISDSGKYTLGDQNWLSPKQNQSSLNWPVTINADKLLGIDKGEQHEGVALNHWGRGSNLETSGISYHCQRTFG